MARGRAVSIVLVAQSLGQLEGLYGREASRTSRESCATKITLGGGVDHETAKLFAEMTGEETRLIEVASRRPVAGSWGWVGATETSTSQQQVRRTVLTADEVRRLPQGKLLVVMTDRPALVVPGFWYDRPARVGRAGCLGAVQGLTAGELAEGLAEPPAGAGGSGPLPRLAPRPPRPTRRPGRRQPAGATVGRESADQQAGG